MAGRYEVIAEDDGFTVLRNDGLPVRVMFVDNHFMVGVAGAHMGGEFTSDRVLVHAITNGIVEIDESYTYVGLTDQYGLVKMVAASISHGWRPKKYFPGVYKWASTQTEKSLAQRISEQRNRLLATADQRYVALAKRLFSQTFKHIMSVRMDRIHPMLYKDAMAIRGAAVALALREIDIRSYHDNWLRLLTGADRPIRSTRRTLSNLPGNIPLNLFECFRLNDAPRYISDRIELITWMIYKNMERGVFIKTLEDANFTRADVAAALDIHCGSASLRRAEPISDMLVCVADYIRATGGNDNQKLPMLARQSVLWHAHAAINNAWNTAFLGISSDAVAVSPPAMPDIPGIRFLSTRDDFANESKIMKHCIASYFTMAARGDIYVFHADYNGESATVEVNRHGLVLQSRGPRNADNGAAKWARAALGRFFATSRNSV